MTYTVELSHSHATKVEVVIPFLTLSGDRRIFTGVKRFIIQLRHDNAQQERVEFSRQQAPLKIVAKGE